MGRAELIALIRRLDEGDDYRSFRATLHCHTHYSDGTMSPTQLIETAARQGFRTVSITDHDTTAAYLERVAGSDTPGSIIDYGAERGVHVIPGVELTCWWRWHPVHILAYGLDPGDEHTLRLCAMTKMAGTKRVNLKWWPVQAMSICQLVLALDGVPVLAHPRFYWVNVRRMVGELVELGGLVGIETEYEYRTHHLRLQCPVWTPRRIGRITDRYDLLRTGGADSHGRDLRRYRA